MNEAIPSDVVPVGGPGPNEVSLAPPGAGLPRGELLVARAMLGVMARFTSRAAAARRFARERDSLRSLARGVGPERGRRPVLIPRPVGLEDSSRRWSVYMTLDHLRIVNDGTAGLIGDLLAGRTPPRVVSTADFKPSPGADESVTAAFAAACERFERVTASAETLRTTATWPHPWFGPLDAGRWHFFTAFHMSLHRGQVETILARS